jgi:chromosome segregation ATPase
MTIKQQLQNIQADQQSKQSKLDQEAKAKREAILDDSERIARLEVLDKQIALKEGAKKALDGEIAKLEVELAEIQDKHNNVIDKSAFLQQTEDKKIAELYKKESALTDSITVRQKLLESVKTEIQDQKRYLKDEQTKIDDTINEWNAQLKEFQDAGIEVEKHKTQVNIDIIRLEQDRDVITADNKLIEEKNIELDTAYQEKAGRYRDELKTFKSDIQASEQTLLELELKNKVRFEAADTRDKSLTIRERAVQTKEFNLTSREKALEMKLGLSQLSIE